MIFRSFDLDLYETDVSDVAMARDWFISVPKLQSKGMRCVVSGMVQS